MLSTIVNRKSYAIAKPKLFKIAMFPRYALLPGYSDIYVYLGYKYMLPNRPTLNVYF